MDKLRRLKKWLLASGKILRRNVSAALRKESFPFALKELFLYLVASAEKFLKSDERNAQKVFRNVEISLIDTFRVSAEKQIFTVVVINESQTLETDISFVHVIFLILGKIS